MRVGTQPARQAIAEAGWTVRWVAVKINVPESHLRGTVRGFCAPSQAVRERLPKILGIPLEELFTADVLRRSYTGPRQESRKRAAVTA